MPLVPILIAVVVIGVLLGFVAWASKRPS